MNIYKSTFFIMTAILFSACASTHIQHPDYGQDCTNLIRSGFIAKVDCVRVFYGTNRTVVSEANISPNDEQDTTHILPKNSQNLNLGRADIWLPKLTTDGGVRILGETPMLKGDIPEEKGELSKYVFITRITQNGKESFIKKLESNMNEKGTDSILLFIHGFNVKFESALIRAAQLSVDLSQDNLFNPGSPVLFSWPSAGKMSLGNYFKDGDNATEAAQYLTELLDILTTDIEIKRINIIAHSMGNRVLVSALETYAADYLQKHPQADIEFRIILAAADVERDIFDQVAGKLEKLNPNVTIYTSDDDLALKASKLLNGVPRLGDTNTNKPYIRDENGYETIDATPVATELFGLGHGYYSSNPFILGDILCTLADVPVQDRSLTSKHYAGREDESEFFLTVVDEARYKPCALSRQYAFEERLPFDIIPPISQGASGGDDDEFDWGDNDSGDIIIGSPFGNEYEPPKSVPERAPAMAEEIIPIAENIDLTFYFASAVWDISSADKARLAALELAYDEVKQIKIIGYADQIGNASSNLELSQKRAQSVADWLIEIGIDPALIEVAAHGETNITSTISNTEDRRVVVSFIYQ